MGTVYKEKKALLLFAIAQTCLTEGNPVFENSRLIRTVPKFFIPILGIFLAYPLSVLISSNFPGLKFPVLVVDLFGFIPSLLVISVALSLYLREGTKERILRIIKIGLFVIAVAASTLFLLGDVLFSSGFNFDRPMIILLILFTFWNKFCPLINYEKHIAFFTLISNENSLKETFASVFSLVGFPLLLIDTYLGFCSFGMGVVGGAGLRDGLNVMLMTLAFYSILLHVTNRLVNRIVE